MLAATPSSTFLEVLAAAVEAVSGAGVRIGLFTGSPTLTPATLLADLVQPTYTGYTRPGVINGTRRGNANGDIIIPYGMVSFQPTNNAALPQTVTGVFMQKDGAPDKLWLAEVLDDPWVIVDTGSALDVIFEIYIKGDAVYGGVCTTCVVP